MEDPLALLDSDEALLPLLEVAKESLTSVSTYRAVVLKAISHPTIFCGYDQLKEILTGASSAMEDAPLAATLDLFSYGKYSTYTKDPGQYLPLNDTQEAKLRQLTLLSCVQDACLRGQTSLTYTSLADALQLSTAPASSVARAVEQVIVSCIYNRAMNGQLCQKSQQLLISQVPVCISRDVPLASLPNLLQQLQSFQDRLDTSHAGLEEAHSTVTQSLEQSAAYWNTVEDRKDKVHAQVSNHPTAGGGSGGTVRMAGWPDSSVGTRRSSASRQSKRSRGGLGGSFTEPFQRY